ncbi:MAG: hypothetical protein K2J68_02870 [Treponemataceae bacterium]|nr:hypothetical protein [Treponemataceae bacterium]
MVEGYSEEEKESAIHFHYDRNERINNAPKIVQDFYSGKMKIEKGFFRILVANKFNRVMLFTVALFFVVVLGVNFLQNPTLGVCAGFECELSAFAYGDEILAQVKIHALQKSLRDKNFRIDEYVAEKKEVAAIFDFLDGESEIATRSQKSGFLQKNEFFLRTNVPNYDIIKVCAQVEILGERVELSANVKR